jgi:hypothetical protein
LVAGFGALKGAGCAVVYHEKASGSRTDLPELAAAVAYMRTGDTLVVWKLDRLARSLKQLIATVESSPSSRISSQLSLKSNQRWALSFVVANLRPSLFSAAIDLLPSAGGPCWGSS